MDSNKPFHTLMTSHVNILVLSWICFYSVLFISAGTYLISNEKGREIFITYLHRRVQHFLSTGLVMFLTFFCFIEINKKGYIFTFSFLLLLKYILFPYPIPSSLYPVRSCIQFHSGLPISLLSCR